MGGYYVRAWDKNLNYSSPTVWKGHLIFRTWSSNCPHLHTETTPPPQMVPDGQNHGRNTQEDRLSERNVSAMQPVAPCLYLNVMQKILVYYILALKSGPSQVCK
jgi:hypothetical protein